MSSDRKKSSITSTSYTWWEEAWESKCEVGIDSGNGFILTLTTVEMY